jgi:Asp-tRNA(Asn)/Glu-tRNA(Gln) amidotransferase A subunit family amidase
MMVLGLLKDSSPLKIFINRILIAVDPTVKRVIEKALQFRCCSATFKKQYKLEDLKEKTQSIWEKIDILVVPTAPTCPTIEEVQNNPIQKFRIRPLYQFC